MLIILRAVFSHLNIEPPYQSFIYTFLTEVGLLITT